MAELKAIIFDMDGVLIDTTPLTISSLKKVLATRGVILPDRSSADFLGLSLRDQMVVWQEKYGLSKDASMIEISKEAFVYQKEALNKTFKKDNALLSLVKQAKDAGILIAVATSSMRYRTLELLHLIGIYDDLSVIITQDDVTHHKPHPESFLTAAEKVGVAPENCIVIEDALNGIEAARAANMRVVAKLTPYQTREDFEGLTNLIFSDFSELSLGTLQNLFS